MIAAALRLKVHSKAMVGASCEAGRPPAIPRGVEKDPAQTRKKRRSHEGETLAKFLASCCILGCRRTVNSKELMFGNQRF